MRVTTHGQQVVLDVGGHAEPSDLTHDVHKLECVDHPLFGGILLGEGLSTVLCWNALRRRRWWRRKRRRRKMVET